MKTRESKLILVIIILISLLIGISINLILNSNVVLINGKQIIKEMTEGEYESKLTELNKSHEDYALQVQENKQKIATAISNQKVETSEDDTIDEIVTNIEKILEAGTSDATATERDIAEGKTAYVNGKIITGIASNVNNLELANTGSFKTGQTITLGYKPKVLITVGTYSGDSSLRFCYYNESLSTSNYACVSGKSFFDKNLGEGSSNYLDTINNDGFTYGPGSNGSVSGTYYAYK